MVAVSGSAWVCACGEVRKEVGTRRGGARV